MFCVVKSLIAVSGFLFYIWVSFFYRIEQFVLKIL